jgi:glutathione S-transferase
LSSTRDAQLGGRDWVTGTRSIAGLTRFVVLCCAKAKEVNLHDLDHLDRFAQRMQTEAGVKSAMHAEGI